MLTRYAALSQRDVADLLNMGSGSAVCKQLASLPGKLSNDRRLRRKVEQIEKRLAEIKSTRNH
jgi:predicted transcriptional regulator